MINKDINYRMHCIRSYQRALVRSMETFNGLTITPRNGPGWLGPDPPKPDPLPGIGGPTSPSSAQSYQVGAPDPLRGVLVVNWDGAMIHCTSIVAGVGAEAAVKGGKAPVVDGGCRLKN